MRARISNMRSLSVVAAVGEVERFIDQREVRHDVAEHRELDQGPVLPGWVVRDGNAGCRCPAAVSSAIITGPRQPSIRPSPSRPAGAAGSRRRSRRRQAFEQRSGTGATTPASRRSVPGPGQRHRPSGTMARPGAAGRTAATAGQREGRADTAMRVPPGPARRAFGPARASAAGIAKAVLQAGVIVVDRAQSRTSRARARRARRAAATARLRKVAGDAAGHHKIEQVALAEQPPR